MAHSDLTDGYKLIGELLLSPAERDPKRVSTLLESLRETLPEVVSKVTEFLAVPASHSSDEYLQTLELTPPCPLYLGSHLFDEPESCNGVGTSGRNPYMLELKGIYSHFGVEMTGGELPDFLPVMVDFLWISLDRGVQDGIGLRRRYLEEYVLRGLGPLSASLEKYSSAYALLVKALEITVQEDLHRLGDAPIWMPPPNGSEDAISLPVLAQGTT